LRNPAIAIQILVRKTNGNLRLPRLAGTEVSPNLDAAKRTYRHLPRLLLSPHTIDGSEPVSSDIRWSSH
jgi:hypothetical protein